MKSLSLIIATALAQGWLDIRHTSSEQTAKLVAFTTELCCKDNQIFIPDPLVYVLNDENLEYKDTRKLIAKFLIHFAASSSMSKDFRLTKKERYVVAQAIIIYHKNKSDLRATNISLMTNWVLDQSSVQGRHFFINDVEPTADESNNWDKLFEAASKAA
ncbi:hypothetical protein [Colwellia sp. MB02u-14]|uniref:hypothetical protein n=1 Tax=Colwellia sp. MB02u-14 TaxID=2759815 RepID=UPI0015F52BDF|nr:hypothetical protein [Colwellia sp. MB02u-14]MBA6304922.1 hypothetical protein [Colwellia sp. MB02u-14]